MTQRTKETIVEFLNILVDAPQEKDKGFEIKIPVTLPVGELVWLLNRQLSEQESPHSFKILHTAYSPQQQSVKQKKKRHLQGKQQLTSTLSTPSFLKSTTRTLAKTPPIKKLLSF